MIENPNSAEASLKAEEVMRDALARQQLATSKRMRRLDWQRRWAPWAAAFLAVGGLAWFFSSDQRIVGIIWIISSAGVLARWRKLSVTAPIAESGS